MLPIGPQNGLSPAQNWGQTKLQTGPNSGPELGPGSAMIRVSSGPASKPNLSLKRLVVRPLKGAAVGLLKAFKILTDGSQQKVFNGNKTPINKPVGW